MYCSGPACGEKPVYTTVVVVLADAVSRASVHSEGLWAVASLPFPCVLQRELKRLERQRREKELTALAVGHYSTALLWRQGLQPWQHFVEYMKEQRRRAEQFHLLQRSVLPALLCRNSTTARGFNPCGLILCVLSTLYMSAVPQ